MNLEPCTHYGKTPPCTDLIIDYGIKKVVIGMRDVNPIVAGKGILKLKNAGIEVIEGVLEDEARRLNEVFITNMVEKRTFVSLKTATT
ncbi:bifunctional diaminohydroxyphosphoribosylaminopyrimidine deaminase/5-amino-6-(5-phosphoribosylamino)uracil reductase RibD, partial [Klebsiella pneumoniae]|uniref:bifunctional diaminohydroxyphosphoribosylaminopyrimidine deaminase/5-amino-6-(5-phosphoribosylamino)uracil reductase RibD n=1 Tax=Klebsiella pneumoniae TaxID=573 RepID=UPI003AF40B2B